MAEFIGTDYGRVVDAILTHAGTTAYKMAAQAGLTQQAILDVRKGRRANPRAETLDRLLQAAGLGWGFLDGFRSSPDAEPPAPDVPPAGQRPGRERK